MKPRDTEGWLTATKHRRRVISTTIAALMLVSLCAVCASTNVSANPLPAGTGPSSVDVQGTYLKYVFVQGYDGALWYRYKSIAGGGDQWGWLGGWTSLGGSLTSSPAATSPATGVIDVFVRGTDNALWWKTTTNSGTSWSNWEQIGGQLAAGTGAGADAQGPNSLDVFVQGTDHGLWYTHWDGTKWSTWKSLGGRLTSSPAAASRQAGIIDVYVRGTDSAVWERSYSSGARHGWYGLGGVLASGTGPAVSVWRTNLASNVVNREDVWVTGTGASCYQKTWTASSGWYSWAGLGGKLTSAPTVDMEKYCIDVWVRWSDGTIYENEYCSGQWTGWGGGMQGPPCQVNCG